VSTVDYGLSSHTVRCDTCGATETVSYQSQEVQFPGWYATVVRRDNKYDVYHECPLCVAVGHAVNPAGLGDDHAK